MGVRVLRLNRRCPSCGAPPRLRTFPEVRHLIEESSRSLRLLSYQCHVSECREIYEIRTEHFRDEGT
jgi:predicted metal-binding protein